MINLTFNNLSKADGSALVNQDDTIIQSTVFGPVDIPQSKVNNEEAVIEILYKPKISIPSSSQSFDQVREMEEFMRSIFKEVVVSRMHPRTSITIMIQEVHNNGLLFSTAVIAVCCALIDAGIPIKSPVAGITIFDKTKESSNESEFNFVFDQDLEFITLSTRGFINEDKLRSAIKSGQFQAKEIFQTIRDEAQKRFNR